MEPIAAFYQHFPTLVTKYTISAVSSITKVPKPPSLPLKGLIEEEEKRVLCTDSPKKA